MTSKLKKRYIYVLIATLFACIAAILCINTSTARADDSTPTTTTETTETTAITVTTAEQLTTAISNGGYIILGADISSSITIAKDTIVTLDLNGYMLTGDEGYGKNVIENYGTLTIIDSSTDKTGTVTIPGNQNANIIYNLGTAYLYGGTYERIWENGDTLYVILNIGVMEIRDIIAKDTTTNTASLICSRSYDKVVDQVELTIYSGEFYSKGGNTVYNQSGCILTIYDGEFETASTGGHAAVLTWATLTIYDGDFTGATYAIAVGATDSQTNTTVIYDGTYTATTAVFISNSTSSGTIELEIDDGTFIGPITTSATNILKDNDEVVVNGGTIETIDITGGTTTVTGGTIDSIEANSGSTLNITGGTVESLTVDEGATVGITGGTVVSLTVDEGADVDITGGSFGEDVSAYITSDSSLIYNEATGTIETIGTYIAKNNAQANVRIYMAAYGWSYANITALKDESELAQAVINAYNEIVNATSETAVSAAYLNAIDAVDEFVADQGNKVLDEIQASIGDLQTTVDGIAKDVGDLQTDVGGLQNTVDEIAEDVEEIAGNVGGLQTDVGDLQNTVDEIAEDVEEIAGNVGGLQTDVGDLQTTVDEIAEDVEEIAGNVGGLQTSVNEIADDVDGLQTDVGGLQTSVDEIAGNVGDLQTDVGDLQNTVDEIADDVDGLQTSVDEIQTSVGDLQTSVDEIQASVSDAQSSEEVQASVDDVQASVDDVQASVDDVQSAVEELQTTVSSTQAGLALIAVALCIIALLLIVLVAVFILKRRPTASK